MEAVEPRIFASAGLLYEEAAREFVRACRRAVARSGRFTLALSGGSTPRGLYSRLSRAPFRRQVAWRRTHVFWADERMVRPDHPESNYGTALKLLLSRVGIPAGQSHRIQGDAAKAETAAADYDRELRRFFRLGPGRFPRFDLVLLGLGTDGHTASLFPRTRALRERRRLAVASLAPSPPIHRVTLTPQVLNNASRVLFLVCGREKARALDRTLRPAGPSTPAGLIRPRRGTLLWLIDRKAAGLTFPSSNYRLSTR